MNDFELLLPTIISHIESSILSNPTKNANFTKMTCKRNNDKFYIEYFTQKQAFQKTLNIAEFSQLLLAETGKHYKNVLISTATKNITVLTSKKGKQTILHKSNLNKNLCQSKAKMSR